MEQEFNRSPCSQFELESITDTQYQQMQQLGEKTAIQTASGVEGQSDIQISADRQAQDVLQRSVPTESSPANASNWHLAVLGVVCFGIFLWNLGGVGLMDARESFYGEGAREMMVRRQFLIPLLNYQTFCDSPILTYWLQILSYRVFGVSEFATRLPSALFACALTFGTYVIGSRLRNNNVGFMAALIVCTSPLMVAFGRLGSADIISSALLTSSIYAVLARFNGASRQAMLVSYVCLSLAVLAQGPFAAVVFIATVFSISVSSSTSVREFRGQISKLEIMMGTLGLLVISIPWFLVVNILTNGSWTAEYFSGISKFFLSFDIASASANFAIAVGALLPWIIFLPAALRFQTGTQRYLQGWLAAVLLTCTVLVAGSPAFALPILPVMALLVAYQFDDWLNTKRNDLLVARYYKSASLSLAIVGLALLLVSALFAIEFVFPELAIMPELFGSAGDWFTARCAGWMKVSLVAAPLLIGTSLCWQYVKLMSGRLQGSINTLFASAITMVVIASPIAFKFAYEVFDADLHRAIKVLIEKKDGHVAMFRDSMPSLSYYLGRPVQTFSNPDQLEQDRSVAGQPPPVSETLDAQDNKSSKVYVISRVDAIRPLVSGHALRVLSKRGQWLVIEAESATLKGL